MRTLMAVLLVMVLAGCGQKGDLYLPDPATAPPAQQTGEDPEADSEEGEEQSP